MTPPMRDGWAGFDFAWTAGYSVIPGIPRTKRPLVKWKPYQDRLPAEAEVLEWKQVYRTINPLVVTGLVSGVVVVDQDGVDGYCTLGKRGKPPETITILSPRGPLHEHLVFKYPHELGRVRNFTGGYDRELPHVDLRGDGGLVVYAGGLHQNGGIYRFREGYGPDEAQPADLHEWPWFYDYIAAHNEKLAKQEAEFAERLAEVAALDHSLFPFPNKGRGSGNATSRTDRHTHRLQRYAEAALRSQASIVAAAQPTTRNLQLFKSAAGLSRFIGAGALSQAVIERELERAACTCGLVHDDGIGSVRATIASGLRAGRDDPILLAPNEQPKSPLDYTRPRNKGYGWRAQIARDINAKQF